MTISLDRLVVGKDSNNSFIYTRNFSIAVFQSIYTDSAGSQSIDLTQFSYPVGTPAFPATVFVSVSPGLTVLIDINPITLPSTNIPTQGGGEFVNSNAGFTIPSTSTDLYIYVVSVPASGSGLLNLSFFV